MTILSHSLVYENQALEIRVAYDHKTNIVTSIKSIWLITHGNIWPVGNLMVHFFDEAINKEIDAVDWREKYNEFINCSVGNLHPVMEQALAPFVR